MLLAILVTAGACSAQSDCLKRTIPVGVYDGDGALAPKLNVASLSGTLQKEPVQVKAVQLPEKPPRIVFLIDTSGSMRAWADLAVNTTEAVLFKLPPQIEAGLAFFSQTTTPVQLPTTDREATRRQLEALRRNTPSWRGKTALRSAINDAIKMFSNLAAGDAIYVVSDGDDNASRLNERQLREGIAGAEVRVFALTIQPTDSLRPRSEELGESLVLRDIAQVTGGTLIYRSLPKLYQLHAFQLVDRQGNPTQFAQDLQRQLSQFLNFYSVEIELPVTVEKPKDWKLELTATGKPQQQTLTLTYPSLLVPCH